MAFTQASPAPPAEATLGPAPRFRLQGRSLQFGPRNDEVAFYRDGRWHSDGRTFAVLESETPTLVTFEGGELRRTEIRGPFRAVQVAAGAIRFGPDSHEVVAIFDDTDAAWYLCPGGLRVDVVLLGPAELAEDAEEEASFSADDFVKKDYNCSRPDFRDNSRHFAGTGESL